MLAASQLMEANISKSNYKVGTIPQDTGFPNGLIKNVPNRRYQVMGRHEV